MSIKLYLIRHCEATGQEPESVLTAHGAMQAEELAIMLQNFKFKLIIASPYVRAIQSATPLANTLGLKIEIDERLRERSLGVVGEDWRTQLARTFDDVDLSFPNGESTTEATTRAMSAINEIIEKGCGPVAIVTHGNLLALIARNFVPSIGFELWSHLTNPDVYEVGIDKPSFVKRVAH